VAEVARLRARVKELELLLDKRQRAAGDGGGPLDVGTPEQLRVLVDNSPGVIYLCRNDERYTMLFLTESVRDLTGYAAAEFLADRVSFVELYHPEDAARIAPRVEAALAERRRYRLRYRIRHKAGHWVWVDETGVGVFGGDDLLYLEGFLSDVSESELAQRELRRAHDKLSRHFDHTPLALMEWDQQWRLTRWAGQAEQIFGWAAHELIGKNWGDWPFVHPDDLDRVRRVALELVEGRAQANVCRNRNLRKDGSVVHCDWFNSAIHDEHGRVVSMLSFVSDITDRVEAEAQVRELNAQLEQRVAQRTAELEAVNQKLKDEVRDREQIARVLFEQSHTMELMLENTAEGVIVADRDGNFLIWNAAARQIIGLDKEAVPAEEWARFYQCYRADGRTLFRTQDLPMVRAIKGESVDDEQMVIRREETGAERLLSINARPMVNEAGQVIGGVIVFRDNTERRRTETALRLVQTAIEQVGDSVVITDAMIDEPGPHILYVNPAFTRLTGYAEDEVISKTPRILQGPETDREVLDQVRAALRSGRPFHGQTIN